MLKAAMKTEPKNVYCSFLLRIWYEDSDGGSWRYSLEDTRTGKRLGFATFDKLVSHLSKISDEKGKSGVIDQK